MRVIAGLVTVLLLVACFATEALAHASLVSVEPRDGSVLTEAPKRIELRFSESVTAGAINLIDAQGKLRVDATVEANAESVTVTPPQGLPRGTSIVSYRVISEDGHPVTGAVTFTVGEPTATAMPANASAGIDALIWLARVCLYVGLFGGVGGAFFVSWIGRSAIGSNVVMAASIIGLVGATVSLGLQGLDVLGLPLSRILTAAPWKVAFGTSLGPALLLASTAMGTGLVALLRPSTGFSRTLSALALAGVGLSLSATGHAATAPPQLLTQPALFVHGVGVAFWLGALAPLAAMLWQRPRESSEVVHRFSNAAVPVVGLLALAGLVLAIVQLGSFRALVDTKYGIILSIKLVLVAGLLDLAALNRFRLAPALGRVAKATKPLVRSIAGECVLAVAILAVVAGWRFTPPPRSLVPDTPLAVHIHSDKAMFQILISPGRVGTDDFVLQLMNGDGSLLSAKETALELSMPARGIEAIARPGELGADGYWHVHGVSLPIAGRWHIRIDALVTDFESIALEDDFDVATE
jgi:copper transport protein